MRKGISFLIRSSGRREELLKACICSIHANFRDKFYLEANYEIIVVGYTHISQKCFKFTLLNRKEDALNMRQAKMMNEAAENAHFSTIVHLDDDMYLSPHWYNVVYRFLDKWDLQPFALYEQRDFEDLKRHYDWSRFNPPDQAIKIPWDTPADITTYVSGGCIIANRDKYLLVKPDDKIQRGVDPIISSNFFRARYRIGTQGECQKALGFHWKEKEGRSRNVHISEYFKDEKFLNRPKILLVTDVMDWAFSNRCDFLLRSLFFDYDCIKITQRSFKNLVYKSIEKKDRTLQSFDLIYYSSYYLAPEIDFGNGVCGFIGIHEHSPQMAKEKAKMMLAGHYSSEHMRNHMSESGIPLYWATDAFDERMFKYQEPVKDFCVGWLGNKARKHKRFEEMEQALKKANIKLLEWKPTGSYYDTIEYYKQISVYVSYSSEEGFNCPLVEAALCGRPFVSTNWGAVNYMNQGGQRIENLDSFIEKILEYKKNRDLRIEDGKKANIEAQKFNWTNQIENYKKLFQGALCRKEKKISGQGSLPNQILETT